MLNKPYLSIQEMVERTEQQRKEIRKTMDAGFFHPEDATIFQNQKPEERKQLYEALHNIPLTEFLAKSGTTGIAGAAYLVPDAIYTAITQYATPQDIVPLISRVVNGWEGGELKIPVFGKRSYEAHKFSGGGALPEEDITGGIDSTNYKQVTLTPISFGIRPAITNDLIEDMQYSIMDYHIRTAAEAMGKFASDLALTTLKTGTDGLGTVNTSLTGDADSTKFSGGATSDIMDALKALGDDGWIGNTMVITPEAMGDAVGLFVSSVGWAAPTLPTKEGYTFKLNDLDIIKSTSPLLHASTDVPGAAMTNCVTIVFNRDYAMLTGRKRWLQVENYANPVEDLAGCTITARQDSVTLYNDAIYVLTET